MHEKLIEKSKAMVTELGAKKAILLYVLEDSTLGWAAFNVGPHEALDIFEAYKTNLLKQPKMPVVVGPPVKC